MACSSISLTLASFMLVIGTFTCEAKRCTDDNIHKCTWGFQTRNGCVFYKKSIECFKALLDDCSDSDKVGVEVLIARDTIDMNLCPGLPDGTCYFNAIRKCTRNIPNSLVHNTEDLRQDEKAGLCQRTKGNIATTLGCLTDLKGVCKDKVVLQRIDTNVENYVSNVKKLCGF